MVFVAINYFSLRFVYVSGIKKIKLKLTNNVSCQSLAAFTSRLGHLYQHLSYIIMWQHCFNFKFAAFQSCCEMHCSALVNS